MLVAAARDAIFTKTPDGIVTSWNAAAERLYGYRADEVMGRNVRMLVPADRHPELDAILARVAAGEPLELETERLTKSGARVQVRLSLSPITRTPGDRRPDQVLVIAQRMLPRHEAETALRSSEQRFRGLIDSDPNGVLLLDPGGTVLYANATVADLLGYTLAELVGRPVETLVPERSRPAHPALRAQYLDAPTTRPMGRGRDLFAVTADGREIPVEIGLSSFATDEGRFVSVVIVDIRERKAAEAERARTAEMLRALLDGLSVGVFFVDASLRMTYVNAALARMYGYSPTELLAGARPPLEPDEAAQTRVRIERALAGEPIANAPGRRWRRDGSSFDVEVSYAPTRDPGGMVTGVVGLVTDVTARRRLERELAHAQRIESVGRLAGGIAHDFNNILTAILGHVDLMLLDAPGAADVSRSAEAIRTSAERAARLTGQLLAFSRRSVLHVETVDINAIVAAMQAMLRPLVTERVELVFTPSSDPTHVRVDRSQLEQVILNLVVNARDATPAGGRITIETRAVEYAEPVRADRYDIEPGRYALLLVRDTGSGMDVDTLAHVFEPFFTTKPSGMGTGLGLATTYGVVRQSGGQVWIESALGQGTTVTVLLPRVDAERQQLEQRPAPSMPARTGRVILAEDDPAPRGIELRILERMGFEVLVAIDGDEALRLAREEAGRVDLVVTDLVMPGRTGTELAAILAGEQPDLPVLFLSGYAEEVLEPHHLAGRRAFLAKPFGSDALAQRVNELLGGVSGSPIGG